MILMVALFFVLVLWGLAAVGAVLLMSKVYDRLFRAFGGI